MDWILKSKRPKERKQKKFDVNTTAYNLGLTGERKPAGRKATNLNKFCLKETTLLNYTKIEDSAQYR